MKKIFLLIANSLLILLNSLQAIASEGGNYFFPILPGTATIRPQLAQRIYNNLPASRKKPSTYNCLKLQELGQRPLAQKIYTKLILKENLPLIKLPIELVTEKKLSEFIALKIENKKSFRNCKALSITSDKNLKLTTSQIDLISKYFPAVTHLGLKGCNIGDDGFEALAKSSLAQQLEVLNICENNISAMSFTKEILSKFYSLRRLNIEFNPVGNTGFKALTESDIAPRIQVLWMSNNSITEAIFTFELFNNFSQLEALTFNRIGLNQQERNLLLSLQPNQLNNTGFEALAKSIIASRLKIVSIGWSGVTNKSFDTALLLDKFVRLEELPIPGLELSSWSFFTITDSVIAPQLTFLNIDSNNFGLNLSKSSLVSFFDKFLKLTKLVLDNNRLGSGGFDALAKSILAPNLITLSASANGITSIAAIDRFINLESLEIGYNNLGDEGFMFLAECPFASKLVVLGVQQTGISERSFTADRISKLLKLKQLLFTLNPIGEAAGAEILRQSSLPESLEYF